MGVAALYGWNGGDSPDVPSEEVLSLTDVVLALPAAVAKGVAGISLDVEPRVQNSSLDQYQQYAELLARLRARIDALSRLFPHVLRDWGC